MASITTLSTPLLLAASLILLQSCSDEAKAERSLGSATELIEKGDFEAAEIELKNTLKSDPGNAEAIKLLGGILLKQGSSFEAARALNAAKSKLPEDDEVALNLATAMLELGFVPDSRATLKELIQRSPENQEAIILLAETSLIPDWMDETEQILDQYEEKTGSIKLAEALIALRRGSVETGNALVDEVINDNPGLAKAHSLRASILRSKNRPDEARLAAKAAADLSGPRSNESIAYANLLMGLGQKKEATALLTKISEETPDFLPVWRTLGEIALADEDDKKASEHFSKVLAKNPVDLRTVLLQSEVWVRGDTPEKAIPLLEKLTSILPSRPPVDLALAKAYLSAKEIPKAGVALDRVLAANPETTEAARLRAQIHLQDGKTPEAITLLEAIRERDPTDSPSRDLLIAAYRAAGNSDKAIALLREKESSTDDSPEARLSRAQLLLGQNKTEEAREALEAIVEKYPDFLAATAGLAGIDFQAGNADAALSRIETFIASYPDSSDAHVVKANLEIAMEKPELAEATLNRAIELKADNAPAYALLMQILTGPENIEKSLGVLNAYLQEFPDDHQARLQQGNLQQELGRHDEARATYMALIESAPDFAPAFNNLATLEADDFDNLEGAAVHARKARTLDPDQPAIADTLGWIEWQLGNFPIALQLLTEAATKIPNDPTVLYHFGVANYSMGQADEAQKAFSKAIGSGSEFPEKADAAKRLAQITEAGTATLADVEKRLEENPQDVISLLQLGKQLTAANRPEEAFEAYKKALEINSALPIALVGQAKLYAGPLADSTKALELAEQAREIAPRDPNVMGALGIAKYLNGDSEEAYGLLKDATSRQSQDATLLFYRGQTAYSLGRIDEARADMKAVAQSSDALSTDATSFLKLTESNAALTPGIQTLVDKSLAHQSLKAPALMVRGSLQSAAGEDPSAAYLEVLEAHPSFDQAKVRLAEFYLADPDKLDEANRLAREARENLADDEGLTGILAKIAFRQNDFPYAARLLEGIASKRELSANELFLLGMSQAEAGQNEKASQSLAKAMESGLSEEDAATAAAQIKALEASDAEEE